MKPALPPFAARAKPLASRAKPLAARAKPLAARAKRLGAGLRRIAVPLALMLTLCALQLAAFWVQSRQVDDAASINEAGRQRMLTQRIALSAAQIALYPDRADTAREVLRSSTDSLFRAHVALTQGGDLGLSGGLSRDLVTLYFAPRPEAGLDLQTRTFVNAARRVADVPPGRIDLAVESLIHTRMPGLPGKLDRAVMLFEEAARSNAIWAAGLNRASFLLVIFALIAHMAGILRPAPQAPAPYRRPPGLGSSP
ncbi:type IV pili methyl-accepting chemotaxis transducer N-terminal domain-containing protein [Alphaproteobacteria bacterium KMM 3653]|uniref:Type IV pili methyl-accepting chemotaxis transducer N-terminal domain-containing protein n=1 Tax=Harenicola maris TaxID=2841044 RepID=A0AAP2CMJ1_9RHOB|nr:type IV pili methyl-accepting chemotaxis transducer N-terminal domain-containing protein [Harenicola maris]